MSPAQQGRHCSVCEKDLVDFTMMSDASLIDHLSKRIDEKTCGRFHPSQLDRVILNPEQRDSGFLLRASAVLAMIGGSFAAVGQESDTSKVQQEGVTVTKEDVMNLERGNNEHIGAVIGSYSQNVNQTVTINGKVTDTLNQEIPFAQITIWKNDVLIGGATTDFNGDYQFSTKDYQDKIIIRVESISFQNFEKNLNLDPGKLDYHLDIKLKQSNQTLQEVGLFIPITDKVNDSILITGKIIDEYGEPMPFVNIILHDANMKVLTGGTSDTNGTYEFEAITSDKKLTLKYHYVGYLSVTQNLTRSNRNKTEYTKDIQLKIARSALMGDMIIIEAKKQTKRRLKKERKEAQREERKSR
jgi:hypothetical protein